MYVKVNVSNEQQNRQFCILLPGGARLLYFSPNKRLVQIPPVRLSWIKSWKLWACDSSHFHKTTHIISGISCYSSAVFVFFVSFHLSPVCRNKCTKALCKLVIKHERNRRLLQNYILSDATSGSRSNVLFLLLLLMWSVVPVVAQPGSSTVAELLLCTSISQVSVSRFLGIPAQSVTLTWEGWMLFWICVNYNGDNRCT